MTDKEYIYNIDKYTIGVVINRKYEMSLTIAKMKNGKIYILGSCYGESARCIDLLIKENQELKKQLNNCYCNRTDCVGRIKDSKVYDSLEQKIETQQKEFINYLEDKIKKEKEDLEQLCDLYKIPKENNGTYKFVHSYINKIEEILQKYREIIGDDKNGN